MQKREIDGKRYPPDRMPKLLDAYQQVVNSLLACDLGLPLFIGGKSMGSRVAATLVSEEDSGNQDILSKNIAGLICLGYPFYPQKQPEKLRLAPLQQGFINTLIIQGERDALGSKQEVLSYALPQHCTVKFLEDGDHGFKPRVKSGFTLQQHIETAVQYMMSFIHDNK